MTTTADQPPAFIDLTNDRSPSHRLTPEQRSELKHLLADGVPRDEIAQAFGVSVSTVQYHATRAGYTRADTPPPPKPTPLGLLFNTQPWADDALCAQTDPELFYPNKGEPTREAKAICGKCLVAAECLDYAVDNDERFGVWGGLSERERRHIKRLINATSTNTAKE